MAENPPKAEQIVYVECCHCSAKIRAKILGEIIEDDEHQYPDKVLFLECQGCGRALVAKAWLMGVDSDGEHWSNLRRVWPDPPVVFSHSIPEDVQDSLQEAESCYKGGNYMSCAVMAGRALEAITKSHTGENTLSKGLKALKESGVIDKRLFDWGDSLRQERNIGAHASGKKVSARDARDVLDFVLAICEYIYVLADRYEAYMERKRESPGSI